MNVEDLSPGVRAKRGERLPVVLSMPDTGVAERNVGDGAPDGVTHLRRRAACDGVLQASDQGSRLRPGLVMVRRAKGDKDRSTLLAEVGGLRRTCASRRRSTRPTARRGSPVSGCRMPWTASTQCGPGARLVLGVSQPVAVHRSARRRRPAASHERLGHPADPGIPRARERRDDDIYTHVVKNSARRREARSTSFTRARAGDEIVAPRPVSRPTYSAPTSLRRSRRSSATMPWARPAPGCYRLVPTMALSCRRRASSASADVAAYFGGSSRRLDASKTASSSMYSSSSSSRLGK